MKENGKAEATSPVSSAASSAPLRGRRYRSKYDIKPTVIHRAQDFDTVVKTTQGDPCGISTANPPHESDATQSQQDGLSNPTRNDNEVHTRLNAHLAEAPTYTSQELEEEAKIFEGMDPDCASLMMDATQILPSDHYFDSTSFVVSNPDLHRRLREHAQSGRLQQQGDHSSGEAGNCQSQADDQCFNDPSSLTGWQSNFPLPDPEIWPLDDIGDFDHFMPGTMDLGRTLTHDGTIQLSTGLDSGTPVEFPDFGDLDSLDHVGDGEAIDFDFAAPLENNEHDR